MQSGDAREHGGKRAIELGTEFVPEFTPDGTLPCVVTDIETGTVVMLAYMNADAVAETLQTGYATFWSRSRQSLWRKGETSGNRLNVVEIRTDCDQDALWIAARLEGHGAACHVGYHSCFYRIVEKPEAADARPQLRFIDEKPRFDPGTVY